jgi:hypothetical protein
MSTIVLSIDDVVIVACDVLQLQIVPPHLMDSHNQPMMSLLSIDKASQGEGRQGKMLK